MSVIIGEVETFPATKADKAQVLKIGEECMEVFSAWENYHECTGGFDICDGCPYEGSYQCVSLLPLIDECADVLQAVCNLLDALDVRDMRRAMERCEQRNRNRGRFDADIQ